MSCPGNTLIEIAGSGEFVEIQPQSTSNVGMLPWFSVTWSSESAGRGPLFPWNNSAGVKLGKNSHDCFFLFAEMACNYRWECFEWVHCYFHCQSRTVGSFSSVQLWELKAVGSNANLLRGWIGSRCRMVGHKWAAETLSRGFPVCPLSFGRCREDW